MKTQLAIPNFQPPTLLHQEWRALLMLPYLWDSGNTTSKGAQVREKVKHLMSGCFDEFSDDLNLNELRGFWRGKEFGTLADTDKQEILWELSEMGFCLEMHALDHHATGSIDANEECMKDIAKCLPHCLQHPACVNLGSTNFGIGHLSWLERAPYLFSLRKLMQGWSGESPNFLYSTQKRISIIWRNTS